MVYNLQENSTYVISSDFSTKRTSGTIPHTSDISVASSSFSFSLDSNSSNVVQNRSSQESLNYSLAFRTTARIGKIVVQHQPHLL